MTDFYALTNRLKNGLTKKETGCKISIAVDDNANENSDTSSQPSEAGERSAVLSTTDDTADKLNEKSQINVGVLPQQPKIDCRDVDYAAMLSANFTAKRNTLRPKKYLNFTPQYFPKVQVTIGAKISMLTLDK